MSESYNDNEIIFIRDKSKYQVVYSISENEFYCRFFFDGDPSVVDETQAHWKGDHDKLMACDEFKEARRKHKLRKYNGE